MPDEPAEPGKAAEPALPRFYANLVNIATSPYDVTLTWIEADPTVLREDQIGPHAMRMEAVAQVVMPLGHAKALIPLLVKVISQYETKFGQIPAPGFDETSKS
jgi:hypothetical protein